MWKSMFFNKLFKYCAYKGYTNFMPNKLYLEHLYGVAMGKKLNLRNPRTYNEKLQWLKLYDHNAKYIVMVDKLAVKEYVANIIGDEYIIPTLGSWDKPEDIDFDSLPNNFVLKCNHDSGSIIICKDKSSFDSIQAVNKLKKYLKKGSYGYTREWPYKNVKRKIIAEPYLEDAKTHELRDYKFFTFSGKVKAMFVATDRQKVGESVKFDYFDENYNYLDITQDHPHAATLPEKPTNFELMKAFAEKLSKGIPHVRVDFYEVNGKVFFGELTFYHHSGIVPFIPEKWDSIFGEWLNINNEDRK